MNSLARRVLTLLVVLALTLSGALVTIASTESRADALAPATVTLTIDSTVPYQETFAVAVDVLGGGSGTPTGTVDVHLGANLMETLTLDVNGHAGTFVWANLLGDFSFTAEYSGDATFDPVISEPSVVSIVKAATTTMVTSSPTPAAYGDPVTVTATVFAAGMGQGPVGQVAFFQVHGGARTWLGTQNLVADGINPSSGTSNPVSLVTSGLRGGADPVTAVYRGNANFRASEGQAAQVVTRAATAVKLRGSPNPASPGTPVTFTATVRNRDADGPVPTGTVALFRTVNGNARRWLGNGTLVDGVAVLTVDPLPRGTNHIVAVYRGNRDFDGSQMARDQRTSTKVT